MRGISALSQSMDDIPYVLSDLEKSRVDLGKSFRSFIGLAIDSGYDLSEIKRRSRVFDRRKIFIHMNPEMNIDINQPVTSSTLFDPTRYEKNVVERWMNEGDGEGINNFVPLAKSALDEIYKNKDEEIFEGEKLFVSSEEINMSDEDEVMKNFFDAIIDIQKNVVFYLRQVLIQKPSSRRFDMSYDSIQSFSAKSAEHFENYEGNEVLHDLFSKMLSCTDATLVAGAYAKHYDFSVFDFVKCACLLFESMQIFARV